MKQRFTHQLRRNRRRSTNGVSLTELVVASLLLGVSLAVVAELMSMSVVANTKLFRQFDAQVASRTALDRMKRDIRMAASVCPGKQCALLATISAAGAKVPVHDSTDPVFSTKTLSSQCLILHMPIYFLDKKNDPLNAAYEPASPQNPLNGVTLPGYDTMIYEVLPDPANPNEFILYQQIIVNSNFRKNANCSYRIATDPLQAPPFARGIIGPLAVAAPVGSPPKIFSFLSRNPVLSEEFAQLDTIKEAFLTPASVGSLGENLCQSISGIGIDVELKRSTDSQVDQSTDKYRGMHADVCLRMPPSAVGVAGFYEN